MLKTLWTGLFVACVHVPVAAVVTGFAGPRAGLTFWLMGIAAHYPLRSVTNLSFPRRFAIWLTAMAVGFSAAIGLAVGVAAMLGTVMTNLFGLVASGQVPIAFVFGLGSAILLVPMLVARALSLVLVRRLSRPRQVALPSATTRQSNQDLETQTAVNCKGVQKESHIQTAGASAGSGRVRTRLPTGAALSSGMNWKNGMLRLWLIINLPLIAYFSYSIYSHHKCEAFWQGQVAKWNQSSKEWEARHNKEWFDSAEKQLYDSADNMFRCRHEKESAVSTLEAFPVGSSVLMLAGWWVARGFKRRHPA